MTHDSPLWAFEREVIFEVANFKEEVLMSLKGRGGEEGEEGILTERSGHWYYLKDRFKQRGVCKKNRQYTYGISIYGIRMYHFG